MGPDFLRRRNRTFPALELRQQDDEFIATVPAGGVGCTDTGGQARCHLLKQLVTRRMPQQIVDALESVKIEEQQCHLLVLARCPRRCLIEAIQQQSAIGQAGELVVMCKPARLRHRLCELSHFLLQKFISFLERVDLTQRRYYFLLAGRERAVANAAAVALSATSCAPLGASRMSGAASTQVCA